MMRSRRQQNWRLGLVQGLGLVKPPPPNPPPPSICWLFCVLLASYCSAVALGSVLPGCSAASDTAAPVPVDIVAAFHSQMLQSSSSSSSSAATPLISGMLVVTPRRRTAAIVHPSHLWIPRGGGEGGEEEDEAAALVAAAAEAGIVREVVEEDGLLNDNEYSSSSSSSSKTNSPVGVDPVDPPVKGGGDDDAAVVASGAVAAVQGVFSEEEGESHNGDAVDATKEEEKLQQDPPSAVVGTHKVVEEGWESRDGSSHRPHAEQATTSGVEDRPMDEATSAVTNTTTTTTSSTPSQEDQEIDAYIDELVASIEGESSDSHVSMGSESISSHPADPTTALKRSMDGSMDDGYDGATDAARNLASEPSTTVSLIDEREVVDAARASEAEEDEIGEQEEEEEEEVNRGEAEDDVDDSVPMPETPSLPRLHGLDDGPAIPDDDDDATTASSSSSPSVLPPPSSLETPAKDVAPSLPPTSPLPRRRPPPPNALYRFLLRRRRLGGHVAAMALAWIAEFAQLYFPAVARAIEKRLKATGGEFDDTRPYRSHRPTSDSTAAQPATLLHLAGTRRTGTSRSQQRSLAKRSDAAALQILRAVSSQARYRYVSPSFLRRYRMGPYSTASTADQSTDDTTTTTTTTPTRPSKGSASDNSAKDDSYVANKDEEDDADWVLRALTAGAKPKTTPSDKADWTEALRAASSSSNGGSSTGSERSSRSVMPPRTSDREGGVLGRIRAVASDGIGRSLLGAYPGDAPPLSGAANVRGLEELGRRYGYGDWSDDEQESDQREEEEDDDDDLMVAMEQPRARGNRSAKQASKKKVKKSSQKIAKKASQRTVKKRRRAKGATAVEYQPDRQRVRRKRTTAHHDGSTLFGIGVEFDFTGSSSADRKRTHRHHRSPSRSPTPPKQSSTTSSTDTSYAATNVAGATTPRSASHRLGMRREAATTVRPILQGAGDNTKRSTPSNLPSRGQGARPALDRVGELKRRHRNIVPDNQEN